MTAEQIRFLNRLKKIPKRTLRKFLKTNTRKQISEQTGIPYHTIANRIRERLGVLLLATIFLLGISSALYSFGDSNPSRKTQLLFRGDRVKTSSLLVASNNTLMPVSPPYYPKTQIMADKLDRIIFCESSGNPKAVNKRSGAKGLCQFIPKTWRYVQKKWNMKLDIDSPYDQLYACERLYREEGERHWKSSKKCWSQN